MSQMKLTHTPGPWSVLVGDNNCGCEGAYGDVFGGDYALATVWADTEDIEKESAANARLMASAPDLLEALKNIAAIVPENWGDGVVNGVVMFKMLAHDIDAVFAAIAKAEGRS